jgi:nicotinate dehydrogenase subunit A
MSALTLNVNGADRTIASDPATPLAYVLRNELGLTGTKIGCAKEQCGACAVLVDGVKVLSCHAPAGQFEGRLIETVESERSSILAKVRAAFVDAGAAQCGYCIPGMVIAIASLLNTKSGGDDAEIRAALQQHLCRCGTHRRVMTAARRLTRGIVAG